MSLIHERLMENAHDRWAIEDEGDGWFLIETKVADPGWEDNDLVQFWVSETEDKVSVEVVSTEPEAVNDQRPHMRKNTVGEYLEACYEMTVSDLLQYLHQLPRPFQSYGARNTYQELTEYGIKTGTT